MCLRGIDCYQITIPTTLFVITINDGNPKDGKTQLRVLNVNSTVTWLPIFAVAPGLRHQRYLEKDVSKNFERLLLLRARGLFAYYNTTMVARTLCVKIWGPFDRKPFCARQSSSVYLRGKLHCTDCQMTGIWTLPRTDSNMTTDEWQHESPFWKEHNHWKDGVSKLICVQPRSFRDELRPIAKFMTTWVSKKRKFVWPYDSNLMNQDRSQTRLLWHSSVSKTYIDKTWKSLAVVRTKLYPCTIIPWLYETYRNTQKYIPYDGDVISSISDIRSYAVSLCTMINNSVTVVDKRMIGHV